MEICFIADNNYKRFINEYAPDKVAKIKNGKTLDQEGKKLEITMAILIIPLVKEKAFNKSPLYVKE